MHHSGEYRDRGLVEALTSGFSGKNYSDIRIMEVCGTHTMSAASFGLRSLLPAGVELVSGPGCPVCVTDQHDIDLYLALGSLPDIIMTTFGDMLRVPGSFTSLDRLRAQGCDTRLVYSPLDALEIARGSSEKEIIFLGVGFETTVPAVALAIATAAKENLGNFSVFSVHKTMPSALRALLSAGEIRVSGLLLPGHVTTIIGCAAYDFIAGELGIPCAVAGFEPVDMLLGVRSILAQIESGKSRVDNVYSRAVTGEPNHRAVELIKEVFMPCDASWRGLGVISGSGLEIAPRYSSLDARKRFTDVLAAVPPAAASPCLCGAILRGQMTPAECPQFGTDCTPTHPIGPCMVSSEGACAAAFRYGGY